MTIVAIRVWGPLGELGLEEKYQVGMDDVTKIEAYTECGQYCELPFLRVWKNEKPFAEFPKNNIVGVYYQTPPQW